LEAHLGLTQQGSKPLYEHTVNHDALRERAARFC